VNDDQREPLPERLPVLPGAARAGILAGAGAVAVLGAAVALGAAAPSSPGEASSASTAAVADPTRWQAPAGVAGVAGGLGHLRGGALLGQIEISAINGSSISLETANGWTRTITVTGDVEIIRGGESISLGDLEVGDTIGLRETRNEDGTFTLEAIVVVVPRVAGTVTAVDGDSITVQRRGGLTQEIATTGSTTYRLGADATSRAEVTVGDRIVAYGEAGAGGAFTATSVVIALPRAAGQVTAISGSSFTLQLRDGTSVTVNVDGDTAYRLPGVTDPGLDDVEVGDIVVVAGTQDGTTIDAQVVASGMGRGMGRGHGPGAGAESDLGGHGMFGAGQDDATADDEADEEGASIS